MQIVVYSDDESIFAGLIQLISNSTQSNTILLEVKDKPSSEQIRYLKQKHHPGCKRDDVIHRVVFI